MLIKWLIKAYIGLSAFPLGNPYVIISAYLYHIIQLYWYPVVKHRGNGFHTIITAKRFHVSVSDLSIVSTRNFFLKTTLDQNKIYFLVFFTGLEMNYNSSLFNGKAYFSVSKILIFGLW